MKRRVLGLTEKIKFIGAHKEKTVTARIDTGATSSSIGKALVKELGLGPVVKQKVIMQAHGKETRDVIKATLKLHGEEFTVSFTVANRMHLKYPVLIGQKILKKGKFLIDPLKKN